MKWIVTYWKHFQKNNFDITDVNNFASFGVPNLFSTTLICKFSVVMHILTYCIWFDHAHKLTFIKNKYNKTVPKITWYQRTHFKLACVVNMVKGLETEVCFVKWMHTLTWLKEQMQSILFWVTSPRVWMSIMPYLPTKETKFNGHGFGVNTFSLESNLQLHLGRTVRDKTTVEYLSPSSISDICYHVFTINSKLDMHISNYSVSHGFRLHHRD